MKSRNILLATLLVNLVATVNLNAEAFTMVCKSGGNMELVINQETGTKLWVNLNFKKAPQGSNQKDPAPGECAWTHRSLNDKEIPSLYSRGTKGKIIGKMSAKKDKIILGGISTSIKKLLKYIKTPNTIFSMQVAKKRMLRKRTKYNLNIQKVY